MFVSNKNEIKTVFFKHIVNRYVLQHIFTYTLRLHIVKYLCFRTQPHSIVIFKDCKLIFI